MPRMSRAHHLRAVALAACALMFTSLLTGCGTKAAPAADEIACAYGSASDGKALKGHLDPGAKPKRYGMNDTVVYMPASNRFYMASNTGSRDPGAPLSYIGYAGQTPMDVQGQLRFRFDPRYACDWFAKHGRRNSTDESAHDGGLGFNLRGKAAVEAGWFKFLAENFGFTAARVVRTVQYVEGTHTTYTWAGLHFSYPANANQETGVLDPQAKAGESIQETYGRQVGLKVDQLLTAKLGGRFFCGVEQPPAGQMPPDYNSKCPPIGFDVLDVTPQDPNLLTARQAYESTRQTAQTAADQAELLAKQKANIGQVERDKAAILVAQLRTAQLQADLEATRARAAAAKCLVYVQAGVDCSPQHNALPRSSITVNGGK
ncbi:MAG: hypothetical protein JWN01_709 [Patescibacteria group bacterium]|nr:hypothetical protein [Patescibacteria group bacterium]